MDGRLIGMWVRTASDRGLLGCRFDADGNYAFSAAKDGKLVGAEHGTFQTTTHPSGHEDDSHGVALLLRTEAGAEHALVVRFRDSEMLLDGQQWRRAGVNADLPGLYSTGSANMKAVTRSLGAVAKRPDEAEDAAILGGWAPSTLLDLKKKRHEQKKRKKKEEEKDKDEQKK